MKKILAILSAAVCLLSAGGFEYHASSLIGYTIVDVKTINGSFNGCELGKKIFFTDGTYVTCSGLGISIAIMPEAVIFARQYQGYTFFKMYVDGDIYDIN